MFTLGQKSILRTAVFMIGIFAALPIAKAVDPPVAGDVSKKESMDVRYARAHLKLAQLDLRRVMEEHKRVPDLLPVTVIENLKRHVAIDETQLEQALKAPDGNLHEIYLRSAKVAVELAEADLKRKQKSYEQSPSTRSSLDVERAVAVVEVAKLHLEITEAKQSSLSSLMYLQWQIEVLRNQVLELQIQVQTGRRTP